MELYQLVFDADKDNKSPEPVGPGLKSTRQVSCRGRFKEQSRVPGCSQSSGGKVLVIHGVDYTISFVIAPGASIAGVMALSHL